MSTGELEKVTKSGLSGLRSRLETSAERHKRQIDFYCNKIVSVVIKTVLVQQNVFCRKMLRDFATDRFPLQQDRFCRNKNRSGATECFLSQDVKRFRDRSIPTATRSFLS